MADGQKRSGVACVGNVILDIVHTIPWWPEKSDVVRISRQSTGLGGGAANVACDLVAMGAAYPVAPVGLIGAGALGDEVLRLFAEAGVGTDRIGRTDRATTAQTHVMSVPGDSRTFFYHPGASDLLDADAIGVAELARAGFRVFYYGYLHLLGALDRLDTDGLPGAARVLGEARAAGMLTCLDLVSSQSEDYDRVVAAVLPEVDVLFLNEVEAARATGLAIAGEADSEGMIAACRALAGSGVRRAVVLHTPRAVVWFEAGAAQVFRPAPVPPERIVSSVGAGDAFAAGAIHGLHEGWDGARCADLGIRAAAQSLSGRTSTDGLRETRLLG